MIKLIKPDFNKNIINISSSLAKFLGEESDKPTLAEIDRELAKGYKNVIFIIFDGLGIYPIENNLEKDSFLRKNIVKTLTSVFPSTTTNATTTLLTNKYPMEHGWFGWSLYFEEINRCINLFLSDDSYTGEKIDENFVGSVLPIEPFYKNAKSGYKISKVVPSYWKDGTKENIHIYKKLDDFFEKIAQICQNNDKNFIYCYCDEPDHTMHDEGVKSEVSKMLIQKIDKMMANLHEKVDDTLFIITADHGHVDIDGYINLYENKPLMDCLEVPPYLEARACAFKVKAGRWAEFERIFNKCYGSDCTLYKSDYFIKENYFGGNFKGEFSRFLGDYIGIVHAKKHFRFCEEGNSFKGHHTSLTEEMEVPLILIKREIVKR